MFLVGGSAVASTFLVGFALAVPFSVSAITEGGSGASTVTAPLLWWHLRFVDVVVIPNPVPAVVNGTGPAPELLPPGGGSYAMDSATAGHSGVRFAFNETTGSAPSTEFELAVTVTNATTGMNVTWVAYFETQSHVLTAGLGFAVYVDLGTGSIPLAGELYVAEECPSVGVCP